MNGDQLKMSKAQRLVSEFSLQKPRGTTNTYLPSILLIPLIRHDIPMHGDLWPILRVPVWLSVVFMG